MSVVAWCLMAVTIGAADPEAVVLEFTAPSRCPPCQQIAPVVSRLQREGFPIRAIDIDTQPNAATPHRIHAVPTFVLLIAGREVDRIEGKPSEGELRRMCERARLANADAAVPDETEPTSPAAPARKPEGKAPSNDVLPKPNRTAEKSDKTFRPAADNKDWTARPSAVNAPKTEKPIIRAKQDDNANLPPANSTDPLHHSVRIRVKDSLGANFGSGTIIDSREGRTYILTCGHIFRKLDDNAVIDVDVFSGTKHETFVARVLRYDLEADVGLIAIPTARPLPSAAVPGLADAAAPGQHVFSVGCSGGEPPTKLQHRVTLLNRYLGPDNVECTGVPIQGRSGGGLFDAQGRLVGVCIAADQRDQRGLYASLKPIHELLDQMQLAHLFPKPEPSSQPQGLVDKNVVAFASTKTTAPRTTASSEESSSVSENVFDEPVATEHPLAAVASSAPTPATPAELKSVLEQSGEAEVVCIVRPLNNPRGASRVVIINRATTKFLSQLTSELDQQTQPTSAVVRQAKYADSEIQPYRRAK